MVPENKEQEGQNKRLIALQQLCPCLVGEGQENTGNTDLAMQFEYVTLYWFHLNSFIPMKSIH